MRSTKTIHVISAHAEGEVGDVIVGGVAPPPGETLWQQSRFIAQDGTLRDFVLNEPRGCVFRNGAAEASRGRRRLHHQLRPHAREIIERSDNAWARTALPRVSR